MAEPTPPRNRDQDIPTRTGEKMGEREPLAPQPQPGPKRDAPQSDEEKYKRGRVPTDSPS